MSLKYKLLKGADLAGLSFLSPVIRLATGEEPRKQLREIGRFIVVPLLAFAAFLWLWSVIAPKHRTKAGEVPTPTVVWDAARGIWMFHEREGAKADAYLAPAAERSSQRAAAEALLAELDELEALAKKHLAEVEASSKERHEKLVAPSKLAYEKRRSESRDARRARTEALTEEAAALAAAGADERLAFLEKVRAQDALDAAEQEEIKTLKTAYEDAAAVAFPEVKDALRAVTLLAEERQFLTKYIEMLGSGSREAKAGEAAESLAAAREEYLAANDGDLYRLATSIVKREGLLATTETSQYAKPWTLPKQIVRSLLCVFAGFLIASAIAVPAGMLCGLSPTFMAAMTPFIALFKPVSPLVWLPIIMIIVGGFMPDPENHWLIVLFGKVPVLADYKIDPMFLSSALTVALCSLWATLVNTALGVASVDKDHLNVARVLRLNLPSRLFKIIIPTALPLIFAGLRISLGVGWMVLVAAEILSTSQGIGKFVNDMYTNGSSQSFAQMFVVVFIVGAIGMVLDRIMIVFQRLVSFDEGRATI